MSLDLFLFTYNCAKRRTPVLIDFLESKLPRQCPQLFVFAFQELSSLLDGTSYNAIDNIMKLTSKQILDDLCVHYEQNICEVGMTHYGNIGLVIFTSDKDSIIDVIGSRGVPIGKCYTSLKGGIGLRVQYQTQLLTFVALHLNAGENDWDLERRNKDLKDVITGVKFDDGWSVLKSQAHCFLMGDFNYRVINNLDQLGNVLDNDLICFKEHNINFEPTYKFKIGKDEYNTKRIPSWCDRILYLTNGEEEVVIYDMMRESTWSDHRPVILHIKLTLKSPENQSGAQNHLLGYDLQHDRNYRLAGIMDTFLWIGLSMMTPIGMSILIVLILLILFLVI